MIQLGLQDNESNVEYWEHFIWFVSGISFLKNHIDCYGSSQIKCMCTAFSNFEAQSFLFLIYCSRCNLHFLFSPIFNATWAFVLILIPSSLWSLVHEEVHFNNLKNLNGLKWNPIKNYEMDVRFKKKNSRLCCRCNEE